MKIVIPGGTGHVGVALSRELRAKGHSVVVLSRGKGDGENVVQWDAKTLGEWAQTFDGADSVINLAGRTVDCRYNKTNLTQMLVSRIDSTRAVGEAIARAANPPKVWLQMSTATIYSSRYDSSNDELTGIIGGDEPNVPEYWRYSVEIAKAWERAQQDSATPKTRKVALRTAMVMSPDKGSIFDVLRGMTRLGLGGPIAGGGQFMSWIHYKDFVRAALLLIENEGIEGPVNLASPNPVPQREFMRALRKAVGMPIGLPAAEWMVKLGAVFLRTDAELVLKSRRVVPGRLLAAGFAFDYPDWPSAAMNLVGAS
ncbi:MAG: TIGR01777 family oxidoreductase [Planctomycetes bacterium]|nr:TIGR01777 family oxidoreductase [Planctomycetota bacterium]